MPRSQRSGKRATAAIAAVALVTTAVATANATPASGQSSSRSTAKAKPLQSKSIAATKFKATKAQLSKLVAPAQKISGLRKAHGSQTVFVQTAGRGAAAASRQAMRTASGSTASRKADARSAALARRAEIQRTTRSVFAQARANDASARHLYTITNLVPGVAMTVDASALKSLAARRDVVKISRIVPKTASNASAAQLTKVLDTWQDTGNIGTGITVGVIDTGIDYTHSDFGGVGTKAAYDDALAHDTEPTWYDDLPDAAQAKIAGGYDFAGDTYNADPTSPDFQPVPHPDTNPLDCTDHGTHVSGTVAGYGVNDDGSRFTGDYSTLTGDDLDNMRIGPGMAPGARLFALRVFGCAGSTNLVGAALDMAADPNGDGNFGDHLDIVNLSLGSDYIPADDPENSEINALAAVGTLPVIAEGNGGDVTDVGGEPGNAPRALAVASSVDAMQLRDGLQENAPDNRVVAGQNSIAYNYDTKGDVLHKDVVLMPGDDGNPSTGNDDGCDPFSPSEAAAVAGKVVWLEWDDDDSTRQCGSAVRSGNAHNAGAVGAIFTSQHNVFGAGITGSPDIPVFQLPLVAVGELRPAVEAGTLNVSFEGSLRGTIKDINPDIVDTLSSFSSRGTHGQVGEPGNPSVAAPGDTITSAGMGTGDDQLTISGTSMATPHTAGIAALVRAANPGWSAEQVKADIVNTAGHDVYSQEAQSGPRYGPARVGSGRVDALAAVHNTILAYDFGTTGGVTPSFGPVEVPAGTVVTKTKSIVLENTGGSSQSVTLSYDPRIEEPGVSYSVSPANLTLAAGSRTTATITLTADGTALRHSIDPTMSTDQGGLPRHYLSDASGNVLITPAGDGATPLRLPVYAAAKPASTLTSTAGYASDGSYGIKSTGDAFDQGTGPTAWTSLASVMDFGVESDQQPECSDMVTTGCTQNQTDKGGDIQYVGAGSFVGQSGTYADGMAYFGISTYGNNTGIRAVQPAVDFDINGDGDPDYEVFATTFTDTDVFVAALYSYADGGVIDAQPLNFTLGDVDTNVFDNNEFVLPVSIAAVIQDAGIDELPASFPISYFGITYSYRNGVQDATDDATFDVLNPKVQLGIEPGFVALYNDVAGVIPAEVSEGTDALVFHLHNASGTRAQRVSLAPQTGTTLTITAPSSIKYGHSATVKTTLKDATSGDPVAGATVGLYGKTVGSSTFSLRKTATTGSGGKASVQVSPTKKTTYQWRFAGGNNHTGSTSPTKVIKVKQVVTMSAKPKSVNKNEKFMVFGTTKPVHSGAKIEIQMRKNGSWHTIDTVKTKKQKLPNGDRKVGYVDTLKEKHKGNYHFRALWNGSSGRADGVSGSVTVHVG